jgi:chromosome segregation ATPase
MVRKKSKGNRGNDKKYRAALAGKNIPVLTLDNKWYQLIKRLGSTTEIVRLTEKLNDLLKRQGKINTELKDIHRLKKKLMENIVASMDEIESSSPQVDRKMDESRRLIEECNAKMDKYRDENLELPKEIEEVNYRLMVATMELCYSRLQQNTKEINEINEWLTSTRIELKKKVLRKQDSETVNFELYSYMPVSYTHLTLPTTIGV